MINVECDSATLFNVFCVLLTVYLTVLYCTVLQISDTEAELPDFFFRGNAKLVSEKYQISF